MKKKIKKAQLGVSTSKTTNELDSLVKSKVSSGAKQWSAKEQADYKKQKSTIGAPPAGYKPKAAKAPKAKKGMTIGKFKMG
jgi:hypothetical protein